MKPSVVALLQSFEDGDSSWTDIRTQVSTLVVLASKTTTEQDVLSVKYEVEDLLRRRGFRVLKSEYDTEDMPKKFSIQSYGRRYVPHYARKEGRRR